jgi:tetratricopeptide (TPR) repeat protein
VGNDSREARTIDVTPPQPLPPQQPQQHEPRPGERDAREVLAERHLASGRPEDALPILDEILAGTRSARLPLVLRARAHQGIARSLHGAIERRSHLDQAVSDMNRAIINYGQDVRSEHLRLRGDLYQALGRGRLAEADYEQAERLEASGR